MTAPANRWKLGLFVVGGAAATLTGLTWVGINQLRRDFHVAYAYFDEALTGLEEGSPIKFRGVSIGVVQRIRVAPDKKHLEVRAALYDEHLRDLGLEVEALDGICPLPDNLRAQVVISWVTGTAFVQVDFFPDPPSGPQQLPFAVPIEHNTLRTVSSTAKSLEDASREVLRELPLLAISAREMVELLRADLAAVRVPELAQQLQSVLRGLDTMIGDLQQRGTVAQATAALQAWRDAAATLAGEHGPLTPLLDELRAVASTLRTEIAAARLGDTSRDVRTAAAALAALGGEAEVQLGGLSTALATVERFLALLERDPGVLLHGRTAGRSPLEERR